MRKLLALALSLLITPAAAQSWIANAPDQSIPYNNHGYLSFVNWTNGCILQYQTGTSIGATGGYPVCLASLPSGILPTFPAQTANTFFAGPDGSSGLPTFRTISATDLGAGTLSPTFSTLYATNLGASGAFVTNEYVTNLFGPSTAGMYVEAGAGQNLILGAGGSGLWQLSSVSLVPQVDNTYALGGALNRVSTGYFVNLGSSGTPVTNGYFSTITPASTTGVTTGTNAAAGAVGEYITSTVLIGANVAITNNTAKDVTSVSLTAGDWDCEGSVIFNPGATTVTTNQYGWISLVSATAPTPPNAGAEAGLSAASQAPGLPLGTLTIGRFRVNVSSTTTVYLSVQSNFTVSTNAAYGFIGCRRVR